jgi:tellurite resistance protein TerC
MPRFQTRLLADIAGLFHSEYVTDRLRKAQTPEAVIEAVGAGQEVATH